MQAANASRGDLSAGQSLAERLVGESIEIAGLAVQAWLVKKQVGQ